MTKAIIEGKALGISVHDHLIVARTGSELQGAGYLTSAVVSAAPAVVPTDYGHTVT